MREVKLIKDVICEVVPCALYSEGVRYDEYTPLEYTDDILMTRPTESGVKLKVAPIHHLCDMSRIRNLSSGQFETKVDEIAIAYTESVQELIKIPFDKIAEANKNLSEENDKLKLDVSRQQKIIKARTKEVDRLCLIEDIHLSMIEMSLWQRIKFLFSSKAWRLPHE